MEKKKRNVKIIIFIVIAILFLNIGLKEDILKGIGWLPNHLGFILPLIKKILCFIVVILSCIILIMNIKFENKKSKIIEIITAILCFFVLSMSIAKFIIIYKEDKSYIDYPSEMLIYEYNGKEYYSYVEKVDVEKEEESLFKQKIQYKFYLSDENAKRTRIVYIVIDRKYNLFKNEWNREHWEYYKDEEIEYNNSST